MGFRQRDIAIAVIGSLILHACLAGFSSVIRMPSLESIDMETARLFRVTLGELETSPRFDRSRIIQQAEIREDRLKKEFTEPVEPEWPKPDLPRPDEGTMVEPEVAEVNDIRDLPPDQAKPPGPPSLLPSGVAQKELDNRIVAIAKDIQRPQIERTYHKIGEGDSAASNGGGGVEGGAGVSPSAPLVDLPGSGQSSPFPETGNGMPLEIAPVNIIPPFMDLKPQPADMKVATLTKIQLPDLRGPDALTRSLLGDPITQPDIVDPDVVIELYVYRPANEDGYFMLAIRPRRDAKGLPVMPKDIIFVLDASASMGHRSFEELKNGLRGCIVQVRQEDAFNIIGFQSRVLAFQGQRVIQGTDALRGQGLKFVDGLQTWGGTDIYNSLYPLALANSVPDRPFMVFLLSDGRPTVGERNSQSIINELTRENNLQASFFSFGAGMSVNTYLLDLLSRRNKGFARFSQSIPAIREEILAFYKEFADPVLIHLTGNYGRINESNIYPKNLPDLYQGSDLRIFGRLNHEKAFNVGITGISHTGRKEMIFRTNVPEKDNAGEEIARLWGYYKAYDIIEQICQLGASQDKVAALHGLQDRYKFELPYRVD